jgi:hypothetical protein
VLDLSPMSPDGNFQDNEGAEKDAQAEAELKCICEAWGTAFRPS